MFAFDFCSLLLFSGCSRSLVSVTEEEQDMIAEYIAHLILKYDRGYEATLLESIAAPEESPDVEENFSVLGEEEQKPDEEQTDSKESGKPGENSGMEAAESNADLNSVFGLADVQVAFTGYKECAMYPEEESDSYFSLVAPDGKKFAVMQFEITNQSAGEKKFSQLETELKYRLDFDAKNYVKPSMTLLVNDLQYIDVVLEPQGTQEAVLVFAVEQNADLSGANLLVYSKTKTAIEKLK